MEMSAADTGTSALCAGVGSGSGADGAEEEVFLDGAAELVEDGEVLGEVAGELREVGVVAEAALLYAEAPAALAARTRYQNVAPAGSPASAQPVTGAATDAIGVQPDTPSVLRSMM